jgi:hypothetical protein
VGQTQMHVLGDTHRPFELDASADVIKQPGHQRFLFNPAANPKR